MYINFKNVYRLLFEKKKLINEIRRILEIFPESVIIRSKLDKELNKGYYSNNEFDKSIVNIRDQISQLSDVNIRYQDEVEGSVEASREIENSLEQFLKNREGKIQENEVTE
jgi:RNase H-fold protein (predicted Holliday junction resolvase)